VFLGQELSSKGELALPFRVPLTPNAPEEVRVVDRIETDLLGLLVLRRATAPTAPRRIVKPLVDFLDRRRHGQDALAMAR
jgi:hypothetical protein